jgi:hypothetical protein
MPELSFKVEQAKVVPYAVAPTLGLQLRIANGRAGERIHTIALRCQIQIETIRRRYTPEEQSRMRDLFGDPNRWSHTLRDMLWTNAIMIVAGFEDSTVAELQLPCTFDFNVAATKYFAGLADGEIPLCLLFSGTVFYAGADDTLQVAPISWEQEARFRLPVQVWRDMMDAYYPNTVWLNLSREAFERLYQYKTQHGIPTWEQVLERVLGQEAVTS